MSLVPGSRRACFFPAMRRCIRSCRRRRQGRRSTRKRILSDAGSGRESAELLPLIEHAQSVADAQKNRARHRGRPGPELTRVNLIEQGSLRGLTTDGIYLYSVVGRQLMQISVAHAALRPLLELPADDFELACCGPSMLLTSRSAGIVARVRTGSPVLEVLATGVLRNSWSHGR